MYMQCEKIKLYSASEILVYHCPRKYVTVAVVLEIHQSEFKGTGSWNLKSQAAIDFFYIC